MILYGGTLVAPIHLKTLTVNTIIFFGTLKIKTSTIPTTLTMLLFPITRHKPIALKSGMKKNKNSSIGTKIHVANGLNLLKNKEFASTMFGILA
jgi:hypothetical protein